MSSNSWIPLKNWIKKKDIYLINSHTQKPFEKMRMKLHLCFGINHLNEICGINVDIKVRQSVQSINIWPASFTHRSSELMKKNLTIVLSVCSVCSLYSHRRKNNNNNNINKLVELSDSVLLSPFRVVFFIIAEWIHF